MTEATYITVSVYRHPTGDCTNGGATSRHDRMLVQVNGGHIHHSELSEDDLDRVLVPGKKGGKMNFVPQKLMQSGEWTMFGGNFVWTTDDRFSQLYGNQPIAVHDRVEEETDF